jgi:DNA-binding MarR family transcriptional regulator
MAPAPPLGFLLSHLADVLRERTAKALTDHGLTPREYGVLWRIDAHGPLSQQELGTLHQIDRTTVVSLVDRLEGAGLLDRSPDPADRRRNALTLTAAGRTRLAEASESVARVEDEFCAPVASGARRALGSTLVAILESVATR